MTGIKEAIVSAEAKLAPGQKLRFASVPAAEAALRRGLFSAVHKGLRVYAFVTPEQCEQFVYDRSDTKFVNERDLRWDLGLTLPQYVPTATTPAPPKKNRFRR